MPASTPIRHSLQFVAAGNTCPKLTVMNLIESPALAMPARPEGRLSFRQFLRLVRENSVAAYPPEALDEDIIEGRLLWRRRFIINVPSSVRHVLLDKLSRQ